MRNGRCCTKRIWFLLIIPGTHLLGPRRCAAVEASQLWLLFSAHNKLLRVVACGHALKDPRSRGGLFTTPLHLRAFPGYRRGAFLTFESLLIQYSALCAGSIATNRSRRSSRTLAEPHVCETTSPGWNATCLWITLCGRSTAGFGCLGILTFKHSSLDDSLTLMFPISSSSP